MATTTIASTTTIPETETKPKFEPLPPAFEGTLRMIPLGGVGEFGLNMMCYEAGSERIIVDCGSMNPEMDMLGVDLVIPDIRWLLEEPEKVKAIVVTHGHEDHIGSIPYFLQKLMVPVYGTRLTLAFLEGRLEEHGLLQSAELIELKYREKIRIGQNFTIQPIHVTHSIPNAAALAITTHAGTVIHTGDYKIDYSPMDGQPFDFFSFAQLGEQGVLALVADSTNSDCEGSTQTERWVADHLEPIFNAATGAILCTTFSSSLHRIQVLLDMAQKFGRKVFIAGRSMERNCAIGADLGHLKIPFDSIYSLRDLPSVRREKRLIIATGSQAEPMSVMSRVARGEHKQVQVEEGDTVVISARMIPGNERAIYRMINHLCRRGAHIFDSHTSEIHSSGHAYRKEMKALLSMVRPRFLVPVHGEIRQLKTHRDLALETGFDPDSIFVIDNGDVLELHAHSAIVVGKVATGHVLVDGKTIDEVGEVVLRDRQHLSEDGMLIAILNVDHATGELLRDPEIVTRGFVYVDENEEMIEELKIVVRDAFELCAPESREDSEILNTEIRRALRKYIRRTYERFPLILPVIQEI